ncbi:alpha-galactosidase/alpha-n-acetylgalactosaminidase [Anaeramoeba flamelloides]|uniref:Alpha-galactosidase n=1 Tax=Anaeramoeba flamelloides TaxID=1746091 RepID=A0AAV8AGL7_9EUKA|nr:alpha-galactosidase/alpha-n-acetylgalactosaminidase [Anaeramoeba flamelloides]|eukprot:Anaeramoba_flamelloidesa811067_241.p1 GENE.a811067_241~~a811067_241.p1  ORF type:complete len:383 (-),score=56.00 a811067_241:247-1395(-)
MNKLFLFCFLAIFSTALCINNGVAVTPPMAFNTWNHFGCNIDEDLAISTMNKMISLGLSDVGYKYFNLDDCWMAKERTTNGDLTSDPTRFSKGIKYLADYAHTKGLKFGAYECMGTKTCQGYPGSFNHYSQDAQTFADWGLDYIKMDWCYTKQNNLDPRVVYPIFRDALNKTGREIVFSICEWGVDSPYLWGKQTGNSWRTSGDISCKWDRMQYCIEQVIGRSKYAGEGGWNDPDMLEIGNGCLTYNEETSHFALWAIAAAPLLIGCDLNSIPESSLEILKNTEIIAVNQDIGSVPGDCIYKKDEKQIWTRKLSDGSVAVVMWNTNIESQDLEVTWEQIGLSCQTATKVRDLVEHTTYNNVDNGWKEISLDSHSVKMFRVYC